MVRLLFKDMQVVFKKKKINSSTIGPQDDFISFLTEQSCGRFTSPAFLCRQHLVPSKNEMPELADGGTDIDSCETKKLKL